MRSRQLTALLATAAILPATADVYTIEGRQTGFGFEPKPPVTPTVTNTPAEPTFRGIWEIDTRGALGGDIAFDDYHAAIKAMMFRAEIAHGGTSYRIDGGEARYDEASRTFHLTGARLTYTGDHPPPCTGSSMICSRQSDPDMEQFELRFTFDDAGLKRFSGTAIATNEGGENGNAIHTWTFTGQRRSPASPARTEP